MNRPIYPLIAPLKFLDRDSAQLLTLGKSMTFPQQSILQTIETVMTGGGVVNVVGGTRDFKKAAPVRLIILKARQMGVSTLIESIAFATCMVRPYTRSLIVSHDLDSSKHLLDMTRRYWETSWFAADNIYTPKNLSGDKIGWHEPDTNIRVTTAKNLAGGRSHTIHFLHASEVAFWEKGKELMKGLSQAVPRQPLTFQFLESTANGFGNYYKQTWDAAVAGDSSYLPVFYPWWQHNAYTADHVGLGHLADNPLSNLDDEERALTRGFKRLGLDARDIRSKLLWRREILGTECGGDLEVFHQEYPATPEEAFVSTGRDVFNPRHLKAAYAPMAGEAGELHEKSGRVIFTPNRDGKLVIFRHPTPDGWYMIGGDAAKQAKGDMAVAEVLDRVTWEQVAEFREDIDPVTFAEQLMLIGKYYNHGMLIPETNMSGGAVAEIVRSNYENVYRHRSDEKVRGQMAGQYGFNTNVQTKPEVIGTLKRALLDRNNNNVGVTIHSRVLYGEMSGYIRTDTGEYRNSASDEESEHDDTVMAFGLAIIGTVHEADSPDRPVQSTRPRGPKQLDRQTRRVAAVADAEIGVEATITPADPDNPDDTDTISMPIHRGKRRAYTQDDVESMYFESDSDPMNPYDNDPW